MVMSLRSPSVCHCSRRATAACRDISQARRRAAPARGPGAPGQEQGRDHQPAERQQQALAVGRHAVRGAGHLPDRRGRGDLDVGLLGRRCHHVAPGGGREAGLGGRADTVAEHRHAPGTGERVGDGVRRAVGLRLLVEDRGKQQARAQERLVGVRPARRGGLGHSLRRRSARRRRRSTGCRPAPATGWSGWWARRCWRGCRRVSCRKQPRLADWDVTRLSTALKADEPEVSRVWSPDFCCGQHLDQRRGVGQVLAQLGRDGGDRIEGRGCVGQELGELLLIGDELLREGRPGADEGAQVAGLSRTATSPAPRSAC